MSSRGRSSLFGDPDPTPEPRAYDPELAEKENDKGIDELGSRISLLKGLSQNIKDEVDDHNSFLERMGLDMSGAKGLITGTMERFKKVFDDKQGRRMTMIVGGTVFVFLMLYFFTRS